VTFALAFLASVPRAQPASGTPKLVVLIVVDQMRGDYVDRFQHEWTGGLKRLVRDGAWFRHAAYPYLTTVTCAGHATVSTGTFPKTHGIIQNAWWDRDRQAMVTCTSDPASKNIGYGGLVPGGDSARNLLVPTFADVMRTEHGARIVTLALKARSAIMLAGHGGEATWLTDTLDGWETSSMYGDGKPIPAVKAYVDAHPIDADFGKTWTRLLPPATYHEVVDKTGEAPPSPWGATFPHVLLGRSDRPDAEYHALWERSPYADEYIARMAAALVETRGLGTHDTTDVLGVSFSTPDLIGHAFGPRSQEIHDAYAHLDRTLAEFLDRLDHVIGRDRYAVALSADHGVTEVPEQAVKAGKDAGRIDAGALAGAIESAAQTALGPGRYVARENGNDAYFLPGVYEKLKQTVGALDAIVKAAHAVPGVAQVFTAEQVSSSASTAGPLRAANLSFVLQRSGDLVIVPKPGWIFSTSGTTHGTSSDDDQHVPIILYGVGVRRGTYSDPATPADVAPTLAALVGVTLSRTAAVPYPSR